MSYKITVRVYQTDSNRFFLVVEQSVFKGGIWAESNGEYVLTMTGSGTSGTLRFVGNDDEIFLVVLGVHNYKRWGDIVTNLDEDQTGAAINPQYYGGPADRAHARESQLAEYSVKNAQGRSITVNYTVAEGNDLRANRGGQSGRF